MEISGPGTPPRYPMSLSIKAPEGIKLQDGESITALVRRNDTPGRLTLEIGGKRLQVLSPLRLIAGTVLSLRVEKQAGQLILHLNESTQKQLALQQAMRQTLPHQQSLKPLLERLQQLSDARPSTPGADSRASAVQRAAVPEGGASGSTSTTGSRAITEAVNRLLAALPSPAKLASADGLQQAIAGSGLFLENALLGGAPRPVLESDLKTVLLRLARAIREQLQAGQQAAAQTGKSQAQQKSLQGLLRQVESGLARIQLNQLNSLTGQQQSDERLQLNLEIPLFSPRQEELDLLQLRIRRDRESGSRPDGPRWSVTLKFSPADYGTIHVVVTLASGKVSTTFWCEQEQTRELFRQNLETLQQRLAEQGLETGRCITLAGSPPEEVVAERAGMDGLVDTRA